MSSSSSTAEKMSFFNVPDEWGGTSLVMTFGLLAQLVLERVAVNRKVLGSIPRRTVFFKVQCILKKLFAYKSVDL
jgi:hypothetical protein